MKYVVVKLKCGHSLEYPADQIGYHTSKLFYCLKCRKMIERENNDFWKNLKVKEA